MEWIELGRLGAPFGVQGWMHVESLHRPAAEALLEYPELDAAAAARRAHELHGLVEGRAQGAGLVARLEGVERPAMRLRR